MLGEEGNGSERAEEWDDMAREDGRTERGEKKNKHEENVVMEERVRQRDRIVRETFKEGYRGLRERQAGEEGRRRTKNGISEGNEAEVVLLQV